MSKLGFFDSHIPVSDLPKEVQVSIMNCIEKRDFLEAKRIRDQWEQKTPSERSPEPIPPAPAA